MVGLVPTTHEHPASKVFMGPRDKREDDGEEGTTNHTNHTNGRAALLLPSPLAGEGLQ